MWGRYTTSDPLGLAAGINTYGYVRGNSLGLSDKLGLFTQVIITDAYYTFNDGWSTGHAAIQINDKVFGFFPPGTDYSDNFFSKGTMREDNLDFFANYIENKKTTGFILNINKEQELTLIKYFQSVKLKPPVYNLTGKNILGGENCASIVVKGLKTIASNIKLSEFAPFSLREDLNKLHENSNPLIKGYQKLN